jgi:hypothetical protein
MQIRVFTFYVQLNDHVHFVFVLLIHVLSFIEMFINGAEGGAASFFDKCFEIMQC